MDLLVLLVSTPLAKVVFAWELLFFLEIHLSFHACQSFGEVAGGASPGTPDRQSSR